MPSRCRMTPSSGCCAACRRGRVAAGQFQQTGIAVLRAPQASGAQAASRLLEDAKGCRSGAARRSMPLASRTPRWRR